jgi:hypothetical protein
MAAGDLTLTAAATKTITGYTLARFEINLETATMAMLFKEAATGIYRTVSLTDASCIGFDVTGSVITDGIVRNVTGEYTKLLGIIFGAATGNANARRTAATQALKDDGIITLTGTVG